MKIEEFKDEDTIFALAIYMGDILCLQKFAKFCNNNLDKKACIIKDGVPYITLQEVFQLINKYLNKEYSEDDYLNIKEIAIHGNWNFFFCHKKEKEKYGEDWFTIGKILQYFHFLENLSSDFILKNKENLIEEFVKYEFECDMGIIPIWETELEKGKSLSKK